MMLLVLIAIFLPLHRGFETSTSILTRKKSPMTISFGCSDGDIVPILSPISIVVSRIKHTHRQSMQLYPNYICKPQISRRN